MGPVMNFYTRHTYIALEGREHWGSWIQLGSEVLRELQFWANVHFESFTQSIWRSFHWGQGKLTSDSDVYGDAGDKGWGGCLCLPSGERLDARGYLTLWQREQSSTWRELYAVWQLLRTFRDRLQPSWTLLWYTDSSNVANNMEKGGSATPAIHRIMLQVFELSRYIGVEIVWEWIPRAMNTYADGLSKVFDKDDWKLHNEAFRLVDELWGPHTVDRFSSDLNHQLESFNSYHWCPGTAGVNAFAQSALDWLSANNWCNPPFCLIGRLLLFLQEVRGEATLIVPHWPKQPWWTRLCPYGRHFADFVVDARVMDAHPQLFASGEHSGNAGGCKMPGYMFYALRVSFARRTGHTGGARCLFPSLCECGPTGVIPRLAGLVCALA
jgi:hypothetical protein